MSIKYNVAMVGATGVVGETLLELLAERDFPVNEVYALASEQSRGKRVMMGSTVLTVDDLANFDFSRVDFAFFSAGAAVSQQYVPIAADEGCIVIDNTSCFRYEPSVPLVIPEVNSEALVNFRQRNIIANPNCSTIQLCVACQPIVDTFGVNRINIATYQSVSGAGRQAVTELVGQTAELLNGQEPTVEVFPQQIAFNAIPHIDQFQDNGYTREEMKMVWETQKIFNDPNLLVNPTAVRIPVFYGHSMAVHLETIQPASIEAVKDLLAKAPGVQLIDDGEYPTIMTHAANHDDVFVGRLRQDLSHPNGINLWVVADNIRKGAALNAIQIAENLIAENFYDNVIN